MQNQVTTKYLRSDNQMITQGNTETTESHINSYACYLSITSDKHNGIDPQSSRNTLSPYTHLITPVDQNNAWTQNNVD